MNIISEWYLETANHTCGAFPPEIDEIEITNLTPIPSIKVKPPRIQESGFHMECTLMNTQDIINDNGQITCTIVTGRVRLFHILEPLLKDNGKLGPEVDTKLLKPVGRLGGDSYVNLGEITDLPRPSLK